MMATASDSTTKSPQLNDLGLPRSNRPLFTARTRERNLFADVRNSSPTGDEDAKVSRIPRSRTFSPEVLERTWSASRPEGIRPSPPRAVTTISIKTAYEKVVRDEEMTSGGLMDVRDGSPSPAARARPASRESDEQRMRRLRTGRAVSLGKEKIARPQSIIQDAEDDLTDVTNASGSTGSISGSVHSLGGSSTDDEIGRKISNFSRDQERAKSALSRGTGLFAKPGVSARVVETTHALTRKSSGSNLGNESGMRVPVQWGSRARKSNNWLQRIMSPESSGEGELPPPPIAENSMDWAGAAAADVPIPTVEAGSPIARTLTPPNSRPTTSGLDDTESPEISQVWDADLDFTARSLQISTSPKLKIRSTKLDNIVAREQEMLSKRAVATIRLEEIRERNSEERSASPEAVRKPSLPELSTTAKTMETIRLPPVEREITIEAPVSPPAELHRGRKSPSESARAQLERTRPRKPSPLAQEQELLQEKTILDEEGEAIPGTPIIVFRNSARNGAGIAGPDSKRTESFDALRKLAKIASPSPSTDTNEPEDIGSEGPFKYHLAADANRKDGGSSTPPKSDVDPEERIAAEASLFELPDMKSESNSARESSPDSHEDVTKTPRQKRDPIDFPTPVVTGAYIETPAPIRIPMFDQSPSPPLTDLDKGDALQEEVSRLALIDFVRGQSANQSASKSVDKTARRTKEPVIPAAATEPTDLALKKRPSRSRPPIRNTANPVSVKDDLRRIHQDAQIDDSTLDDFDLLLGADADDLDLDSTTIPEPKVNLDKNERGEPLTDKERERRLEMLAYERMNKSLQNGLTNIRDAKRGIERLENRVSSSPEPATATLHGQANCDSCASHSANHLTLPVPRLWSRDVERWSGFRFSWLGVTLTLFAAWYVTETITCEYICHPTYATTNNWSYNDPFWGGALPTLADRLAGGMLSVLRDVLWNLTVSVWDVWTGVDMSGNPGRQKPPHTMPVWSEGSMFEDERI